MSTSDYTFSAIVDHHLTVTLVEGDYRELATALVTAGHRLTLFKQDELNLETAFMALANGITS